MQYLMKKHVPLDRMTRMPTTELPIAKQNIAWLASSLAGAPGGVRCFPFRMIWRPPVAS